MSKLQEMLTKAIEGVVPTKTLDALAGEVGGNVRQVKSVLAGKVACPALASLRGIARVLEVDFEALKAASEADGCEYDAEGFSISCPLSRRIKVAEMESAKLKRGLGSKTIAERQRAVAESVSPASRVTDPIGESANDEGQEPEVDTEMESLWARGARGDMKALSKYRKRRKEKQKQA